MTPLAFSRSNDWKEMRRYAELIIPKGPTERERERERERNILL